LRSLPCAKRGVQVTIYADRAADVSGAGGPTFGRVLGYATGHELGHVLLHSGVHDTAVLMKGVWSKRDWQRAAVSIIPFGPTDMRRIAAFHERATPKLSGSLRIDPPLRPRVRFQVWSCVVGDPGVARNELGSERIELLPADCIGSMLFVLSSIPQSEGSTCLVRKQKLETRSFDSVAFHP
jgi:hypothetical protein